MSKKGKGGGRVTQAKPKTYHEMAPKDPEKFWPWYHRQQANSVTIDRKGNVR